MITLGTCAFGGQFPGLCMVGNANAGSAQILIELWQMANMICCYKDYSVP